MKTFPFIERAGLALASLVVTTFLLFCAFELLPGLPPKLGLNKVLYYALKERYIKDPSLVLRVKPNFRYDGVFEGDIRGLFTESTFKPVPYHAQYDINGFRNKYGEAPADIVVLGDSYMEVGVDNDDTFAAILEKASGLKTANYGMGWYGPFQYLEVFKRYGLKNKPKTALFSIFEGNDLKDMVKYMEWQNGSSYYNFDRYSRNFVIRYFQCLQDTAQMLAKLAVRRWDPRRAELNLGSNTFHTVFVYPIEKRSPKELAGSVEVLKLKEILREFKNVCEANGIQPMVLFIPSKAHVYLPYAKMPASSPKDMEEQIRNRKTVENAVRAAAEETGILWVSFTEVFDKAAKEGNFVYYETDTHWNTEGRRLAAEAVTSRLSAGE